MSLRPWIVLGTLLALVIGNIILIANEEILSVTRATQQFNLVDPLSDLRYTRADREENLKAFGLDARGVTEVLKRLERLETAQGERLGLLLRDVEDQSALKAALCGDAEQIAPRYGAMRFFVREDGSQRRPLTRDTIGGALEQQDWSRAVNIVGVYEALELGAEREKDATVMGIAALLTRSEEKAVERRSPWGPSLSTGSWSWAKVRSAHPSVEDDVFDYLALMHLVVELAQTEGSVCGA